MFGVIGVSAAADTAVWRALASCADARAAGGGKVVIEADGDYQFYGLVTFRNGGRYILRLAGATISQTKTFSAGLHFHTCEHVSISDGEFFGLGGAAGEFNGASSSHNGVAGIYVEYGDVLRVRASRFKDFAGGAIFVYGGRVRDFENVTAEGIGYPWIDPVGQGNQGNGGDAAIHLNPLPGSSFPGWIYEDRFVNCRLFNHAFGIRAVATKSFIMSGCEIGPIPGQHGVYGTELDGVVATGNLIYDCRQQGFKNQLENYAGRFVGPEWEAGETYAAGDLARYTSVLYECVTPHTAGGSFTGAEWQIADRYRLGPGVFDSNVVLRCAEGFYQAAVPLVAGHPLWSAGWRVRDNTFTDCTGSAIRGDRMRGADISGNKVDGGGAFAILLSDFSGRVRSNSVSGSTNSAILMAVAEDVWIEDNRLVDTATGGADDAQRSPVTFFASSEEAETPRPSARPVVRMRGNEFRWTGGPPAGRFLIFTDDTRLRLEISGTRSDTGRRRRVRWDGVVLGSSGNDFAGFTGAQ